MPDARVIPIGGEPDPSEGPTRTQAQDPDLGSGGPIGTRGTPGRGTGRRNPSSRSRGLGGVPAQKRSPRKAAQRQEAQEQPIEPMRASERALRIAAQRVPERSESEPDSERAKTPAPSAPARTRDRLPAGTPGIPASDWLVGFSTAAKEVFGDAWEPRLAEFLAFLRRRLTGDYVVDDYGFDVELTERFFVTALRPIAQKWFRIEVIGADNVPEVGGALVVSNHSGTVPVDGLMTAVTLFDHTGRHLRPLGADLIFSVPFLGDLARKGGTTLACNEDAERMLRGGELVGVWPEGFKGIGKPFSERYRLQRFGRGGFVSAALRTGVPIIPTAVVGAEEIYPIIANVGSLARLLGLPYLPVTPLFPLLGPLGLIPLPSKWYIEFGEPIRTDAYDDGAADDPMLVFNVTDQVRETIQQTLYSLLMQRPGVFSR